MDQKKLELLSVFSFRKKRRIKKASIEGSRFKATIYDIQEKHNNTFSNRSYIRFYIDVEIYGGQKLEFVSEKYHLCDIEMENGSTCYVILYDNEFFLDEASIKIKGNIDKNEGYITEIPKTKNKKSSKF